MPAPPVLHLEGEGLTGKAKEALGFYQLEAGREVNNRPVWKHASGRDWFLAWDRARWAVQPEEHIGAADGWISTTMVFWSSRFPSDRDGWKWWDSTRWHDEPSLKCSEATLPPTPPVLHLKGDGLPHTAKGKEALGFYKLEAGRKVNNRPVWKHASG